MGSRKRNRWNNDNFVNHPIAKQIHYESQDIYSSCKTVNPSPFTKLVNLHQYGINISNFLEINDDRQKTFLKRISKYTESFKSICKNKKVNSIYGPENLTKLDRRLKQKLVKRPTMRGIIEEYEVRLRNVLIFLQKEQQQQQKKEIEKVDKENLENNSNQANTNDLIKTKINTTKPSSLKKVTTTTTTAHPSSSVKSKEATKKLDLKEIRLNRIEKARDNQVKKSLIVVWAIENEFHRLMVHTICRWYGLSSYSKDNDGNRYTFIEIDSDIDNFDERLKNTYSDFIFNC